jgi:hypothetical protein
MVAVLMATAAAGVDRASSWVQAVLLAVVVSAHLVVVVMLVRWPGLPLTTRCWELLAPPAHSASSGYQR